MAAPRQLVVNADDFGFTRDVNAGVIEAHRNGVLTATTLMANGEAFDDAARLACENPSLDVGCHLVLVQGRSLVSGRDLPPSIPALLGALARRRIEPYAEFKAQIEKVLGAGLRPTHLDTHKHTHLWPAVLDAVGRIAHEFCIPWVRRPFDFPMQSTPAPLSVRAVSRAAGLVRPWFQKTLARYGCRTTDHFAGFQMTGRFRTAELVTLIRNLPPGSTEFMCHPGRCGDELLAARTRLKQSRMRELEALTAPETRIAVSEAGIEVVSFKEL